MFICKNCCVENQLIFIATSQGTCEICKQFDVCASINKEQLILKSVASSSKDVHITGLVKALEAISPDVAEAACTQYLKNRNYSVIRIT